MAWIGDHPSQEYKNYIGNPQLKAENVTVQFTQEQVDEFIRCKTDYLYFIKNYIKIVNVDHGLVSFNMWDFQEDIVNTVHNNRFSIMKLPRQVGKTTAVGSYLMWVALFHKDQNIAILANKGETAKEIISRIQKSYENLPLWLQQGVREWNKHSMILENGSRILATSTGSSAGRGQSFNIVMLDEFAFVPRNIAEDFITSIYPVISSGTKTKIIMVSTPNGMNLFYKYWTDAVNKRNLYAPYEAHWSQVPGRDEKWKRDTLSNMTEEQFEQEFECVAGETLLDTETGKQTIENIFNNSKEIFVLYKITREDGKIYIGTTSKHLIKKRMNGHRISKRFKGFKFDHEILEESNCKEYIDGKESHYIQKYDSFNNGLNNSIDGKGNHLSENFTTRGYKFSKKSKNKMSQARKRVIKKKGPYRHKFTKEEKEHFSKIRKGKVWNYSIDVEVYDKIRCHFQKEKNQFQIKEYNLFGKKIISTIERQFAKKYKDLYKITPNHIINIIKNKTIR